MIATLQQDCNLIFLESSSPAYLEMEKPSVVVIVYISILPVLNGVRLLPICPEPILSAKGSPHGQAKPPASSPETR